MARLASLGRVVSGKLQGRSGVEQRGWGCYGAETQQHNQRKDAVQASVARQRADFQRSGRGWDKCKIGAEQEADKQERLLE
jgi:hypothetical protein